MLEVVDIKASYGQASVLKGVSMRVGKGEVITLMGRNGMGKTTTLRSILGLKKVSSGRIIFNGKTVTNWRADHVARLGIGLVPEGRRIFKSLTVEENLIAVERKPQGHTERWNVSRVFSLFPRLQERRTNRGNQLSGGEQQMLAIGRGLMTNPQLLILDEATEGLAPRIRQEIWAALGTLAADNQAIIVVDKNFKPLLKLGHRHYVLSSGQIVWEGDSRSFGECLDDVSSHLGVAVRDFGQQ